MPELTTWPLIGAIILLFYSWQKFNIWTDSELKELRVETSYLPRHFTTWPRFISFAGLYSLCIVFIYVLIMISPGTLSVLVNGDPGNLLTKFNEQGWLIALLIITGIAPNFPVLKNVELYLRREFHKLAFIPSEANSFIVKLQSNDVFRPIDKTIDEVLKEMTDARFEMRDFYIPNENSETNDLNYRFIRYKWCKLNYLLFKFRKWTGSCVANRAMEPCNAIFNIFENKTKETAGEIHSLIDKRQALLTLGEEYREERESNLNDKLNDLLEHMYTLVSCGIHATSKVPRQREEKFRTFDLFPKTEAANVIDLDTLISSTAVVFVVTLIPTFIYYFILKSGPGGQAGVPGNAGEAALWALVSLLMNASAIFGAVFIHNKMSDERSISVGYGEKAVSHPSVMQRVLAAATGYALGLITLLVFFAPKAGIVKAFNVAWPWAFLSAVTAGFIIYHLNVSIYKKNTPRKYLLRVTEALFQGTGTALVGVIIVIIAIDRSNTSLSMMELIRQRMPFIIFSVTVFGLIGAGIGYIFPQRYRNILWKERRIHTRHPIASPATILADGKSNACNIIDISLSGVSVDTDIPHGFGSHIQVEVPDIGKMPGIVVRKGLHKTCLELLLNRTLEKKVRDYFNQSASTYEPVTVRGL